MANSLEIILDYTYDAVDNRVSVTDIIGGQPGDVEFFNYDNLNRPISFTQTGSGVADKRFEITYDIASHLETIQRFNNLAGGSTPTVETDFGFDLNGRLESLVHGLSGGAGLAYNLTYDKVNRITRIISPDGDADFEYDLSDQLTDADYTYQYDPGTGQFLSVDPLSFEMGDSNLYRYVGNSPLNFNSSHHLR
ncbi:MAG: hypothetical protein AAGG02_03890 [Cyanobacteria bacterium P01_H01_bin.15]